MNNELRYERLKRITESLKPYRGTNRYPFSDRAHNYKYFVPVEVNGETEFHVGYYYKWDTEEMSVAEYEFKKPMMSKKELKQWNDRGRFDSTLKQHVTEKYERYTKQPKVDLIIRSDNTVEFVTDNFHQGMRQIFSGWRYSNGLFQSSINHGGVIYLMNEKTIPIFRGLRFNVDTLEIHPSSKYQVVYSKINRTKSKEAQDLYADKLNMAYAFMKCMNPEEFKEDMDSVFREHVGTDSYYWSQSILKEAQMKADKMFFEKPVEAVYLYMKSLHVGYYLSSKAHASDWILKFKRKFTKYIQEKHDTFDKEYLTHLDPFKSSTWNIAITVNGKMVERLK